MTARLLMFARERTCADQEAARLCLERLGVQPIEINISRDREAAQMLLDWVGALAVPTFVVADEDGQPISPPLPLNDGQSIRNFDRGSIISEPNFGTLRTFLARHGFLAR
ncbi:MAG TPA: glutaredoxin domain-containing protein [Anaerolineae bacterium]